jgi:AcrR family transcriptional regulator
MTFVRPAPRTAPATPSDAADGRPTRQRLLHTGLRLFAQHGYAKTSTRAIAEHAQVNVAAISYHFGDKAGLYKAAFLEPFWSEARTGEPVAEQTLRETLRTLYDGFIEPLKHGDLAHLSVKLHCREMLEPTGLWDEEIEFGIAPVHRTLVAALCRHMGLKRPDDELQRLAVCIAGLGVHLHVGHDVIDALAPRLNRMPQAFERWADRLVGYAEAMVAAEAQRRDAVTAAKQKARP